MSIYFLKSKHCSVVTNLTATDSSNCDCRFEWKVYRKTEQTVTALLFIVQYLNENGNLISRRTITYVFRQVSSLITPWNQYTKQPHPSLVYPKKSFEMSISQIGQAILELNSVKNSLSPVAFSNSLISYFTKFLLENSIIYLKRASFDCRQKRFRSARKIKG